MGALRIYIKQAYQYDLHGAVRHFAGQNPQSLNPVAGDLPPSRQWRGYGNYIDVTEDIGNLQKLILEWTANRDDNGDITPSIFQAQKGVSGSLLFESEAYVLVKQWLIEDVSAPLNAIDVKIRDMACNKYYEGYQITQKGLQYCEKDVCEFNINLKQKEASYSCIRSTMIADNWQNWFPTKDVQNGFKKHPRFSYCNEIRPNGQLVAIWKLGSFNFVLTNTILIPLIILVNGIIAVIKAIIAVINFLGGNITAPNYIDPADIIESQEQAFVESAGCGREHPAPLIRDYFLNVCGKCGVDVNADTAPIFFAQNIKVDTSTRGVIDAENPHYNACYFNAPVQRGIRRVTLPSPFRAPDYNDTDYWVPDNEPLLTFDMFLDQLCTLYNAEWRIKNNHLYFQRKDFFLNGNYIFDFGKNGVDRTKLLEGVCFEWDEVKIPAIATLEYETDSVDSCGNEGRKNMNGKVVFGNTSNNPLIEGIKTIVPRFGATKFRFDGASGDYIYDAGQANVNSQLFAPLFNIMRPILQRVDEFNAYGLLLSDETAALPKVLLWDGVSVNAARCIRPFSVNNATGIAEPQINQYYNNYPQPELWIGRHEPNTFVQGSGLIAASYPAFFYTVKNAIGGTIVSNPAMLVNYNMYFEAGFYDTLWDWFWWIEDPIKNPKSGQTFTLKMEACCDDIEKLGLFGDGSAVQLGQNIKLDHGFYPDGQIKEISLSYDPENSLGAYIEISGTT